MRWRLPQHRTEAQAGGPQGAAHAPVKRRDLRVGALSGGEGETVGEAYAVPAMARGVARHRRVRCEQADAEGGDRGDGGAEAALVLGGTDQRLGIVDRAKQQPDPIRGPAFESPGGSGMMGVGAIEPGDHHIGVENAAD